jgi:Zn-dependent protease with chaperone function
LVLASLLLQPFLAASPAAAADDLDRLRSQIEKDQSAFSRLARSVNDAPLNTMSEALTLASVLERAASDFEASAQVYRGLAGGGPAAPMASLCAEGVTEIAAGARSAAASLRSGSNSGFQIAQNRINSGRQRLSLAIDQYNAYIKAHPSSPSAGSSRGDPTGSLGQLTMLTAPLVAGIGGYLMIAAVVLNRLFSSRLRRLVDGLERRVSWGSISGVYGLHLILGVAVAYLALLFAALVVVDFGLLAADGITQARRVPGMLVVALVIVVVGSLLGIVKGLFGSRRDGGDGVQMGETKEPGLWELSREVAASVGTRAADSIVLSPMPGISVREEGGLLGLLLRRTRRVLTVGAPSIVGLSVQQFRAILAHEYGHFSNRDTAWSSLTYRAGSAVEETVGTMRQITAMGGWFKLVGSINPALWILWLYRWLFAYLTSGFSRLREVCADQEAVERYGARAFVGGLVVVVVNERLFWGVVFPRMVELAGESQYLTDVNAVVAMARQRLSPQELERMVGEVAALRPSPFDSHPALGDRLAYAGRLSTASKARTEEGAEPLVDRFADWAALSANLSLLLAGSLMPRRGQARAQGSAP